MALIRDNILASAGYVPGEQPTDLSVIKLNTNESPYPPSPKVMEALRGVTAEQLRRYPSPSAKAFRDAAATVHGVDPEMILCTNGGDELLALLVRACARESDRIAFLEPSYSLYPVLTAIHGATAVPLQYRIEADHWPLPEGIEKTDASLLLIVNPNAPSGTFESPEVLAHIARQFKGVLVIDEAYVDFAERSAIELVRTLPNVVILRTMSKGYGLAGIRFGYGIGPAGLLRELEKARDSYPCDAVAIAAATAAIEDQHYARELAEKVKAERARVTGRLRDIGFAVPESSSNFVLAQTPGHVNAQPLYEGLKARRILIRYFNLPRLTDKIRITIGTPEQNDALLKALAELI